MHSVFKILFGVILGLSAVSADASDIPYNKFYSRLVNAKEVDPDGKVQIVHCIQPSDKDKALPTNLAVEIVSGDEHIPLTFDEDHCFRLPINEEWSKRNAVLHHSTSEHLVMSMGVQSRLPKSLSLSYKELMESVPAYERVRGSQGLIARMFFPNAKGLILAFGKNAKANVVMHVDNGDQRFESDANGLVHVPYDPRWNEARVELSEMPKTMAPDMAN